MLVLACKIQIGGLILRFCESVEINSTWKNLTSTCTIRLPKKITIGDNALKDMIKPGQIVKVELGYGAPVPEFYGYVARVKPTVPLEIECEDAMYTLKQKNVSYAARNADVKNIVATFWGGGLRLLGDSIKIGSFRIANKTGAQVLQTLRDDYGLDSFFRENVLCIGNPYEPGAPRKKFSSTKNIVSADSLEWKDAPDVKIKVKAINIEADNTRIEAVVGDADGEQRTLHYSGLMVGRTKAEATALLKQYALSDMEKLKYSGFRGAFTAFGQPSVQHGQIVELQDVGFADRNGAFYIDGVRKTFGADGYRQEITIGAKWKI